MTATVCEETLHSAAELLGFVADLCLGQQETMNVALCRFTHSYFPATDLAGKARALGDGLARALGDADVSPEAQP